MSDKQMQDWEKAIISDAFKISPVLQESLKTAYKNKNIDLKTECINILSVRSGLRSRYIEENIEEIINL